MSTTIQDIEAPPADPLEFTLTLPVSKTALQRVRSADNPTRSLEIGQLKLYVAGLMTICEKMREPTPSERARCASIAITHLETALLFAQQALTAK